MTKKVAFEGGHAGFNVTAGKRTPAGEYEWDFNNKVARAFEIEMMQYEDVQLIRTDDPTGRRDVPLKERVAKANAFGADVFLAFHHNADKGIWAEHTGTETYSYGSGKSLELAKLIHKGQVEAYGLRDRGVKDGSHLYVIKNTRMPAVLVEGGFMDSTIDIVKMRNDNVLAEAGRNAAKATAQFLNLKRKETSPPKVEEPKEVESVYILTGGLTTENAKIITEFFMEQGWYADIRIRKGENPRAVTGGLDPVNRKAAEDFLNAKGWYYKAYTREKLPK